MCFECCGCILLDGDCVVSELISLTLCVEAIDGCIMGIGQRGMGSLKKEKEREKGRGGR